jgi:putative proteasome-type protease
LRFSARVGEREINEISKGKKKMTYCVGMLLEKGLVMLSDSRTNAGIDHINTFRKMAWFEEPNERVLVLMSAGNLAITQSLLSLLRERLHSDDEQINLLKVPNMYEAARCVGDTLRDVHRRDGAALRDFNIDFTASFILGGQIKGENLRLFQIYAAGNFIEASEDTPFFQIGEIKYGKPIVDRVVKRSTSLIEAAKCALISMDSTIRSNLSVGLPLDLMVVRRDELKVTCHVNIDQENEYFNLLRSSWGNSLREAFHQLPNPDWLTYNHCQ